MTNSESKVISNVNNLSLKFDLNPKRNLFMKLFPVHISNFKLDGGAMFGIIPKTLWERKMPSDELNRIQMVTRSLLLVSENKRILKDS